ncbi:hypothetical protein [Cobetia sp. 1AS1]|uniref:hypothetical protein n=1 Tax=Cobetia sp. 1AS1 TaxID=3040016 RepID=UPI00244A671B|nr:hypothetical protein [Cobetia sp. 1AS1]MDH2293185.1 hypothetical protein [Cobetia sp. 1AS1]
MSEKEQLIINSREEAFDLIEKALDGVKEDKIIDLDIKGDWSKITILIKGDNYQASLNGRLIKALSELQTQLNRIYANALYGKSAKALSNDEREEIELIFQVSKGSSLIEIDLGNWLEKLSEAGIEKMTGTEIVIVVLGLAVVWGGSKAFNAYNTRKQNETDQQHATELAIKSQEEETKRQAALITALGESNETIRLAIKEKSQMDSNILKATPTADSVEINEKIYNRSDIEEANRSERQSTELDRQDDFYHIAGIATKPEGFTVTLSDKQGASIRAELAKDKLKPDELDELWEALRDDEPIFIKLTVRTRLGAINSATMIGMNSKFSQH